MGDGLNERSGRFWAIMDLTAQNDSPEDADRQAGEKSLAKTAAAERDLLREEAGFAGKLLRKKIDGGIQENSISRRPNDLSGNHGPYLGQTWGEGNGEAPSTNDAARNWRTHDMNEKMLAKEYRRGLRVCGNRTFYSQTLDFLFGRKR